MAGLTLGLVLAEAALRVIGLSYPPFFQPDAVTGISLRPNTSGWFNQEGHGYVSISSQGTRDRERPLAKPADTYRVAVLGDSFVEALQVSADRTFVRLLEKQLRECDFQAGKTIDVMNFGVSGFGTGQELRLLETRVVGFSPDLIIVAFFPGNDLRNNSRDLEEDRIRPFYFLDENGGLQLDESFAASDEFRRRTHWLRQAGKELAKYMHTLQLVYYLKDSTGFDPQHETARVADVGLDDLAFVVPQDENWEKAWRLTEHLIQAFQQRAAGMGAEFILVTLSTGIQVFPDITKRRDFAARLGVEDLFYPERRLTAFGQSAGIRVVTLAPQLQRFADDNNVYLHGFANTRMGYGHWNEAGHAAAAELLGLELCRDGRQIEPPHGAGGAR
jgi:hypothetical protein